MHFHLTQNHGVNYFSQWAELRFKIVRIFALNFKDYFVWQNQQTHKLRYKICSYKQKISDVFRSKLIWFSMSLQWADIFYKRWLVDKQCQIWDIWRVLQICAAADLKFPFLMYWVCKTQLGSADKISAERKIFYKTKFPDQLAVRYKIT